MRTNLSPLGLGFRSVLRTLPTRAVPFRELLGTSAKAGRAETRDVGRSSLLSAVPASIEGTAGGTAELLSSNASSTACPFGTAELPAGGENWNVEYSTSGSGSKLNPNLRCGKLRKKLQGVSVMSSRKGCMFGGLPHVHPGDLETSNQRSEHGGYRSRIFASGEARTERSRARPSRHKSSTLRSDP